MSTDEQGQAIEPVVQVIRRLDLEPGDVLFLSFPHRVSLRDLECMQNHVGDALGGVKVMVMEEGARVEGVLRKQAPVELDENAGIPMGEDEWEWNWAPGGGIEWDGESVYRDGRLIGALR